MNTMTERHPQDGKPYYCDACGAGFGEYLSCDSATCRLESPKLAQSRMLVTVLNATSVKRTDT